MSEIKLYCSCGASWTGRFDPAYPSVVNQTSLWRRDHTGEGHAPATPEQAAAARRKAESEVQYE